MEWISCKTALPFAAHGEVGKTPIISDDVLCCWPDETLEIANYDHADKFWTLVRGHSFVQADCEPTHWMELPAPPTK